MLNSNLYSFQQLIKLVIVFLLISISSCKSHLDFNLKNNKASVFNTLFLSKDDPVNVQVTEILNLSVGNEIQLYSMTSDGEEYSNIPVKWSLVNDIGVLSVSSGGTKGVFLAVSEGTGYIQIENDGIEKRITVKVRSQGSNVWDFSDSTDYIFDSSFLEVDAGRASLKKIDTSYSGTDFNSGNHFGTFLNSDKLTMKTKPGTNDVGVDLGWTPKADKIVWYWSMNKESSPTSSLKSDQSSLISCDRQNLFEEDSYIDQGLFLINGGSNGTIGCDSSLLNQEKDEITISGWIKNVDDFKSPWLPILVKTKDGRGWNIHRNNTTNEIYLRVDTDLSSNSTCFTSGASPLDGSWHHIAFTLNRGSVKAYVDGLLVNTCSYSHGAGFSTSSDTLLRFFRASYGSSSTTFDEWTFWTKELTEDEVFEVYDYQKSNFTELSSSWTPHWSDIISYWKMNGNWKDSSGNGNDLVALGNAGFSDNAKVGNQSASFDGIDAKAQGPQSSDILSNANQEISIFFWAKPSNISSSNISNRIISIHQGAAASSALAIGFGNFNKLQFYNSVSAVTRSWDTDVSINEWYHVGLVYNGTCFQRYLNGNKEGSCIVENLSAGGSFNTMIGSFNENDNNLYSGLIDELAIWKKALSASDGLEIYNHQKQKYAAYYRSAIRDFGSFQTLNNIEVDSVLPFNREFTSASESVSDYSFLSGDLSLGLFGYWPLNEISGSTAKNYSAIGASLDGSLLNSVDVGERGILNNAFHFTSNARVVVDSSSMLFTSYTACHWINADRMPDRSKVSQTFNNGKSGNFSFNWDHDNGTVDLRGTFQHHDGIAWRFAKVSTQLKNKKWYHICGSWNGAELKVYVNGTLEDTVSNVTNVDQRNGDFYIGSGLNSATFDGHVDDMIIWNRSLSDSEIQQVYRRGSNRIKYQVRYCSDSICSTGPEWRGPGGDGTTYFSELYNRSSADISNMFSSCDSSGDNLCSAKEFSFIGETQSVPYRFDFVDSLINNGSAFNARYFQYRVLMEAEENSACGGEPCLPSLTAINFETANDFYTHSPSVTSKNPVTVSGEISRVEENVTSGCSVKYQFSKDETNFHYYNSGSWVAAADDEMQANTVNEVSSTLKEFISSGSLYFRAYLKSDGSLDCRLDKIMIVEKI